MSYLRTYYFAKHEKKNPGDTEHDGLPGSQDSASTPSRTGNPWKCCVMLAEGINHHHWSECLSRRWMWHHTALQCITQNYTALRSLTLHYTALHCITPHCTCNIPHFSELHRVMLSDPSQYCIILPRRAFQRFTLHYIALDYLYIESQCIQLHYTTCMARLLTT